MIMTEYHHDGGHGWLLIAEVDCQRVGLTANDVSPYSYCTVINGRSVWALERGMDCAEFLKRAEGHERSETDHFDGNYSPIRQWASIATLHDRQWVSPFERARKAG